MATESSSIAVTLVYSKGPRNAQELVLCVSQGTTLADLLESATVKQIVESEGLHSADAGIWGRKVQRSTVLRENDRVEIYRPLTVDPKVARRERFQKQGAGTAGLFASRRKGARAGY